MTRDIGFILANILRGEHVRNNLALACMVTTVTRGENARPDRDEGVVKVGLESANSVTINGV